MRPLGVTQSMGRPGSALDNAAAESLFSTMEFELLRREPFAGRDAAGAAVAAWIDDYNTERLHSTVGMLPPVTYEGSRPPLRGEEDQGGGMSRHSSPEEPNNRYVGWGCAAHRAGPPLRPQGPLTRSLRDGLRPPLTPEPLRPLGHASHRGQAHGPAPPTARTLPAQDPTTEVSTVRVD